MNAPTPKQAAANTPDQRWRDAHAYAADLAERDALRSKVADLRKVLEYVLQDEHLIPRASSSCREVVRAALDLLNRTQMTEPEYLGDGVYAGHNDGTIGLTVNDHNNEVLVWLEPAVLSALIFYAKRIGVLRE